MEIFHIGKICSSMSHFHRHLREIDCSLAAVGRPATGYSNGAEFGGGKSKTPLHTAPKCVLLTVGYIVTTVIKGMRGLFLQMYLVNSQNFDSFANFCVQ